MYQQITIKTLHKQGAKGTKIAQELGCHRNTVRNIIQRERVIEKQTRVKPSVLESYKLQIKEWLDKKVSRRRIFEILQEASALNSTYDTLCKYIQKHFPKAVTAYGVQINDPGETAEIDFGYLGMLPGPQGSLVKTYGVAVILCYSRVGYYAICYDQKLGTLIGELTNAFEYFGGVPKRLKVDNMRTAILTNQHYDLQFNQDFLEYTNHYTTVITPCTPHHPEQKGTVESGIKYFQNNFVSGRIFTDGADLKRQLLNWMTGYANRRIHGTTRQVPMEMFAREEKDCLQVLPAEPFAFFNRGTRTVGANCHIHFLNNYYSVPACLVGKEVTVRWNEHLLRVIADGEQVALHHLESEIGKYVTCRSHLPDYKVYSTTEHQAKMETRFANLGEDAHAYFRALLEQKDPYWSRTARNILGLCELYGNEPVNASLKRALYYTVRDVVTIRSILEKKLYEIPPEPKLLSTNRPENEFIRDLNYYTANS